MPTVWSPAVRDTPVGAACVGVVGTPVVRTQKRAAPLFLARTRTL